MTPAPRIQGRNMNKISGQNMTPNAPKQDKLDSFGAIFLVIFLHCMWGLGFQNELSRQFICGSCPTVPEGHKFPRVTTPEKPRKIPQAPAEPRRTPGEPPERPRRALWETPGEPSKRQISSESLAEGCAPWMGPSGTLESCLPWWSWLFWAQKHGKPPKKTRIFP